MALEQKLLPEPEHYINQQIINICGREYLRETEGFWTYIIEKKQIQKKFVVADRYFLLVKEKI